MQFQAVNVQRISYAYKLKFATRIEVYDVIIRDDENHVISISEVFESEKINTRDELAEFLYNSIAHNRKIRAYRERDTTFTFALDQTIHDLAFEIFIELNNKLDFSERLK